LLRVHAGQKPSGSSPSNESFSQVGNLQKRKVGVQSSRRPFQCPHCRKLFKANRLLKQHVRVHTDEKPFSCRHCPDRFIWHHQLKQHVLKSHSGGISLTFDVLCCVVAQR